MNDDANENNDAGNCRMNNNKAQTCKSFEYKTKITGSTPADSNTLDAKVVVPLKYLSNFWRPLDLHLINCKVELDLSWLKNCVISLIYQEQIVVDTPAANSPVPATAVTLTTGATFQINNAKFYVLIATLSINNNIRFLENIK